MKQFNELLSSAAERVRRSFRQPDAEDYGELIWLIDPEAGASQPRRPWRQELDRVYASSIKPFEDPVRQTL